MRECDRGTDGQTSCDNSRFCLRTNNNVTWIAPVCAIAVFRHFDWFTSNRDIKYRCGIEFGDLLFLENAFRHDWQFVQSTLPTEICGSVYGRTVHAAHWSRLWPSIARASCIIYRCRSNSARNHAADLFIISVVELLFKTEVGIHLNGVRISYIAVQFETHIFYNILQY